MIHKPENHAYVGQAKNLGNRILQHVCDATSNRGLVGDFDDHLRKYINMDDWELQLKPCPQENLNDLEKEYYKEKKNNKSYIVLNKRNPPNTQCKQQD